MTPEEVVRAELAAWDRLDVDGIMSFFAPDAVWDNVPIGPATGRDEIRQAVDAYVGRMTSADLEIVNVAVAGNVVLIERVDHFLFDGQKIDARVMGAFEITGDMISAWRDYFDTGHGDGPVKDS